MKTNKIFINKSKSILDALNLLNSINNINRLILFVTDNKIVIGSLTDGDIRRSLAVDKDLNKNIEEICNKNFFFEYETNNYLNLKSFYNKNIKTLPILNKDKTISRIIDLEETKALLPLECVIMAGGRGKRLSPITDQTPKPMLLLNGKPIIEYNIDRLISFGIRKIYISVKYLSKQIQDYFGDGSSKGIEIEYIHEDQPLGTVGAVKFIEKTIKSEYVLVMNSDIFSNINFEEIFIKIRNSKSEMAVATKDYNIKIPFGIFETKNNTILKLKEKPTYTYYSNAGVYIFKTKLISIIPENIFFDITDLIDKLILENKKIIHCPIRGYWIDIGAPDDYIKAKEFAKYLN
jgi:dTDP-glucose pyrophosphorylase